MTRIFQSIFEGIGWLLIVASPLLIGGGIGLAVYLSEPDFARLVLASVLLLAGLVVGIVWANKVRKNNGTIHFLSRIYRTPELDDNESKKETTQSE